MQGQSNSDGVSADPLYDGLVLPVGTEVNDKGVDLTNWPNGAARNCAGLPYLDKYARQAGATEVKIVREATNGLDINGNLDTVSTLIARLEAKGWEPDYWIYQQGEAECIAGAAPPATSVYNTATASARFQYSTSLLGRLAHLVLARYPNCRFVICTVPMCDFADYGGVGQSAVGEPIVEAAQRQLAVDNPDRVLLCDSRNPSKVPMSGDSVHMSVGLAGGFDVTMGRIRELWAEAAADEVVPDDFTVPEEVILHDDFDWVGTLHVPAGASAQTLAVADELERILLAMTGDAITRDSVATGAGIMIGTKAEWEADDYGYASPGAVPAWVSDTYDYSIVSEGAVLRILGADGDGVSAGVYKFLELLGYYALMPTDIWEVIPSHHRVTVRLAVGQSIPIDFVTTSFGSAGGQYSDGTTRLTDWHRRNRIPTGGYSFFHAWGKIIDDSQDTFDAHPEYQGGTNKLCVFESEVRRLALEWAQAEIISHTSTRVQTLAIADGVAGWDGICAGTNEQEHYSPTDRQIELANHVQARLDAGGTPGAIFDWDLDTSYKTETGAEDAEDHAATILVSDPTNCAKWRDIAGEPAPLWCAADYGSAHGPNGVDAHLDAAAIAGAVPIFVLYNIMDRNGSPSQGAVSLVAYKSFLDSIAAVIASRNCIWIIEPDGVSLMYEMSGGVNGSAANERKEAIAYAVTGLTAAGGRVYVDAGDNNFRPASEIAGILGDCAINLAAGVALNVAHTELIEDEYDYYLAIKALEPLVGNVVIDSGRAGVGHYSSHVGDRSNVEYINPPALGTLDGTGGKANRPTEGVAMGPRPTTKMDVADYPGLDALLWVKFPTSSDDDSPRIGQQPENPSVNAPDPGDFYAQYWQDVYDAGVGLDFSKWEPITGDTYRGVRLSILAYGSASVPPTLPIDPRIVVGVTDGYIQGGQTWDDVAAAYRDAGAVDIIPYSYTALFSFFTAKPGYGRACSMEKLLVDTARVHGTEGTIKGMISEASPGWGVWGLGFWVMARMLTDDTRVDPDALKTEFIEAAFGDYADLIEPYYENMLTLTPISEDMLHRLYQCIKDVIDAAPPTAILDRAYDLAIFVRYYETLYQFETLETVTEFDVMFNWLWRARAHDLVPVCLAFQVPSRWQPWLNTEMPILHPGFTFTATSTKPWADKDTAISHAELDIIIADGIAHNDLLPFTPIGFSEDLVFPDLAASDRRRQLFLYSNRNHSFYLHMQPGQDRWVVTVRGGHASNVEGSSYLRVVDLASGETVAELEARIDITDVLSVPLDPDTLYRVEVDANGGVDWDCPGFATTKITDFQPAMYAGDFNGFFSVPAGTSVIGGYFSPRVIFKNQANATVFTSSVTPGYQSFAITAPTENEVWKFERANSKFVLMTVPPGISPHPNELLIPIEIA